MNLQDLKKQIPFQWKVQAFTPMKAPEKTGCICVGYIDARQVQDLLDEAVGPENWSNHFTMHKNNLFCTLAIKVGSEWVGKTDCGTESDMEAEKGEASDAFKRAAVKWGIGRFLYELPEVRLKVAKKGASYVPVDDAGRELYGKDALSDHCNRLCVAKPAKPASKPRTKTPEPKPAESTDTQLPELTSDQRTRVSRVYNFVRDNYENGKSINPKDFGRAVYAILGHWPDTTADEEHVLSTIKIEVAKKCDDAGNVPLKEAS